MANENVKLNLGLHGTNPLLGARERIRDNPFFSQEDWEYIQKGNLQGVTLSSYVDALAGAKATIENPEKFISDNKLQYADTSTRVGRLMNEIYKDQLSMNPDEKRTRTVVDASGKEVSETYTASDYDYYNAIYKNNAEYGYQKYNQKLLEQAKKDLSFGEKLFTTVGALGTRGLIGLWTGVNDFLGFVNGTFSALSVGLTASGNFEDAMKAFVTGTDLQAEESGIILNALGNGLDRYTEGIAEYESGHSWTRKVNGEDTFVGKYIGGALESTGRMYATAWMGPASCAGFYAGLMAGDVRESYKTISQRGGSVTYTSLVLNSAIKAGAQAAIEVLLEKIMGGATQIDALTKGKRLTAGAASSLTRSGVKRIVKDAFQEGLEEVFQDTSDFFINKLFSLENDAFSLFDQDFGELCVDENGNSVLTAQSLLDSFVIAALMSFGGSGLSILKSEISRGSEKDSFAEKLNPIAYNEYKITLKSFGNTFAELGELSKRYNKSKDKRVANAIGEAYARMFEAYQMIGSVYGEVGEKRVKDAETLLEVIQKKIDEGKYSPAFSPEVDAAIIFDGIKLDKKEVKASGFYNDALEDLKNAQVANATDTVSTDDAAENKHTEFAKDLHKQDPSVDQVVFTKEGKNAVKISKENGKSTVVVPENMASLGADAVAQAMSQNKVIKGFIMSGSDTLKASLNDMLELYRMDEAHKNATVDSMVADLLFTKGNDSFFREVLGVAEKDALRMFTEFTKTAARLMKNKEALEESFNKGAKESAYRNIVTPHDVRNLKTAYDNMLSALREYYENHPELEIPNGVFSKPDEKNLKSHRFTKDIANRLIVDGFDSLTKEEKEIVISYAKNAPAPTVRDREMMMNYIDNKDQKNRILAVKAINSWYNGEFYSKYDGRIYLPEESFANAAFNTALKRRNMTVEDFIDASKNNPELYGEFLNDFYGISGRSETNDPFFKVNIVGDTVLLIPTEAAVLAFKGDMFEAEKPHTGVDTRTVAIDDLVSIKWMLGKEISTEQASHLTITDVINNPKTLLSSKIKSEILGKYGELSPRTAFLYLRDFVSTRKSADKENHLTIVKLRDGSYSFANFEKYYDGVDMSIKKFPSNSFKIGELGFSGVYASDSVKNIQVVIKPLRGEQRGGFNPDTRTITISSKMSFEAQLKTLVHETHHAVQFANNQIGGFSFDAMIKVVNGKYTYRSKDSERLLKYIWNNYFEGDKKEPTSEDIRRLARFVYLSTGEADAKGLSSEEQLVYYPTVISSDSDKYVISLFDGSRFELSKTSGTSRAAKAVTENRPKYDPSTDYGSPFAIVNGQAVKFEDTGSCEQFGSSDSQVSYLITTRLPTRTTYTLIMSDSFSLANDSALYKTILDNYVKDGKSITLVDRSQTVSIPVTTSEESLKNYSSALYDASSSEELDIDDFTLPNSNSDLSFSDQAKLLNLVISRLNSDPTAFSDKVEALKAVDEFFDDGSSIEVATSLIANNYVTAKDFPQDFEIAAVATEKAPEVKEEKKKFTREVKSATKEGQNKESRERLKSVILGKNVDKNGRIHLNKADVQSNPIIQPFTKADGTVQIDKDLALFIADYQGKNAKDPELASLVRKGELTGVKSSGKTSGGKSKVSILAYVADHPKMDSSTFSLIKTHFFKDQEVINSREELEEMTLVADSAYRVGALILHQEREKTKYLEDLGFTEEKVNELIEREGFVSAIRKMEEIALADTKANHLWMSYNEESSSDEGGLASENETGTVKAQQTLMDPVARRVLAISFLRYYNGRLEEAWSSISAVKKALKFNSLPAYQKVYNEKVQSDFGGSSNEKGESYSFDLENVSSGEDIEENLLEAEKLEADMLKNIKKADRERVNTAMIDLFMELARFKEYPSFQRLYTELAAYFSSHPTEVLSLSEQATVKDILNLIGKDPEYAGTVKTFREMEDWAEKNRLKVTSRESIMAGIRRQVSRLSNIYKAVKAAQSSGKKDSVSKFFESFENFDTYFEVTDSGIKHKELSKNFKTLVQQKNEIFDLTNKIVRSYRGNAKELAKVREALRASSERAAAAEAKLSEEKEKTARLEQENEQLRTRKPVTRVIYVDKVRTQVSGTLPIPEKFRKILNEDFEAYRNSEIQGFGEGMSHLNTGKKTFWENFLYPRLEKFSEEELIELADYLSTTTVLVGTDPDAYKKYYAARAYSMVYLISKNKRRPFLDPDIVSKVESVAATEMSTGMSYGNVAKVAIDLIHPYIDLEMSIAEDFGIEVDDEIFKKIENATVANDSKALENALLELENTLVNANANKLRDRSFLEKLQGWQRNMMLSSPLTWIRNQVSNATISLNNKGGEVIGKLIVSLTKSENNALSKEARIESLLNKPSWSAKDITTLSRYFKKIGLRGVIDLDINGKTVSLDALVALEKYPNNPKVKEFFSLNHKGVVYSTLGAVKSSIEKQYEIVGKDISEKLKGETGAKIHEALDADMKNQKSIFNQVFDSASKYDSRSTRSKMSTAESIANTIAEKLKNEIYRKDFFGEGSAKNAFIRKFAHFANWSSDFLTTMLSDEFWVRKRTVYYLERIMVQENMTADDINFSNSNFVRAFSDAYVMASRDYMHKTNFINKLERKIKDKSEVLWYAYKQVFPFAPSAWNWAVEGMLSMSPIGLMQSIYQYANLEEQIVKYQNAEARGESTTPYRFAKYAAMRGIGKGALGSTAFLAMAILGIFGVARIDEDDDKWKLSIGNSVYIDITNVFSSQGTYCGLVIGGMIHDLFEDSSEKDFEDKMKYLRQMLVNVSDIMVSGNPIDDLYTSFRHSSSLGDFFLGVASRPFDTVLPSFCYALEALNPYKIKYSSGFKGKLQQMYEKALFGLPSTLSAVSGWKLGIDFTIDPYTGEKQLAYGNSELESIVTTAFNKSSPIRFRRVTPAEQELVRLGVSKSMLTGKYKINGNDVKLSRKDVITANEYYGRLNASDLDAFRSNRVKYSVENEKTGKYVNLSYSQMTDKQKAAVYERIMSKNSGYTKIYMLTSSGKYKYFASESEFKALRKLGITTNVYKETKKQSGFIKIS